jgi:hypothetical protein
MDRPGLVDTALDRSTPSATATSGCVSAGDPQSERTPYRLGAGEDSQAARRELWETCERLVHQDAAREHTAGHVDR